MTIAEVIAMGQAIAAIKRGTIAAREIADRIEGLVVTADDADAESTGKGPLYVVLRAPRPVDGTVKALPGAEARLEADSPTGQREIP